MKNRIIKINGLILICFAFFLSSCNKTHQTDYLKVGFINPPDSSRPGVYWYFMDGNIERKAITADLESMKEEGIGYVVFLEVNVGVPRGKVDFLSEEWQELFKHAVRESERLGIRIILGSGPGWAGSGGPWVTPAQSMLHLVACDTTVQGPALFNAALPVPEPKRPFFGENSLTPDLKKLRDDWYEDIFILAFPTPVNPEIIPMIDEKALYYRAPFTSQAGVLPFLPASVPYELTGGSVIDQKKIIDISDKLDADGMLKWDIPRGRWTIMRFVTRNNGAVTRPAPMPGLGFECDKFDTASFNAHYEAYVGKLIEKTQPEKAKSEGGWTMIHIDSWEMGAQNWSPYFREEFIKRRGYDPKPFLPAYTGLVIDNTEVTERFLWDIRQTSSELIVENHAGHFKTLGKRNNFRLSIEPYDMNPAADLDLGMVADIPMCEFWSEGYGFNSAFSCIESTSIAHVKGAPVVAAEAFTADSHEAWKQYPGSMKNQGDWAFSMGINRLFYHTFAHKPYDDKYRPGMTMGPYGVHWDRGQTWWPMADEYHRYISRCQYMLSQGKAVADILYLAAEGAPHVFRPPSTALEGSVFLPDKKSYSFDGCSPLYLIKNAKIKDSLITFPGGGSYRILVLPDINTMTPELLRKIKSLAEAGAVIAGNPPVRSPSLSGFPDCDEQVAAMAKELWGNNKIPTGILLHNFGKGKIWWGKGLVNKNKGIRNNPDSLTLYPDFALTDSILAIAGIKPDFKASGNIRYTHRSLPDCEIYFISNKTDSTVTDTCYFRDGTRYAELWDAVTGEIRPLNISFNDDGVAGAGIKLESYQSYFVLFYKTSKSKKTKESSRQFLTEKHILTTLNWQWEVDFDTSRKGPGVVHFENLDDWTGRPEDGIRHYSGTAVYSKRFDLPESAGSVRNQEIYLNLGHVKNIARVKLNNQVAGTVWTSPWQVRITGMLKNKNNILEIEVANLWINRLIGDEAEPWDGIKEGKWPEWYLNGTQRPTNRYTFTTHRYYK
ncbi:MAG TPA: glycosyl hydrolase, partial [Bacteroidales bacterium]|nr:glycosyl hydrolase [Bacteroidales bacterium]